MSPQITIRRIALLLTALAMLACTGCASLRPTQPAAQASRKPVGVPCPISYLPTLAVGRYGTLKCDYMKGYEGHRGTTWEYTEWHKDDWKSGGKVDGAARLLRVEAHPDEDHPCHYKYYKDFEVRFTSHPSDDQPPTAAVRVFRHQRATLTVQHNPKNK